MGRPRKNDKETQESVEDTGTGEPEAEATLQAEAETAAEAAPAAEQETAADEPAAEPEPAPPAESAAEAEEVIADAAATDELGTDAPVGTAAPVSEAPAEAPKQKKRLPRAQRRQRPKTKRGSGGERKPIVRLPRPERERGPRKERRGVVVSSAMDKTIVVRVETVKPHPVYKKVVRRSRKFQVHDEGNVAKPGDVVRIVETRPLSKTKTWRLAEVLEEAK